MNVREQGRIAWDRFADRAFPRLVRLSLDRMLQGAQDGSDEIDAEVGRTLALLALPGAVISFLLFDKYGSLMQFFRGQRNFDPYAASLSDEYFFIVLSMVVCGAVAVWKSGSIFLDRRDYLNLVPLPVRTRTILLANLVALFLFALLFAVDVNLISGWLFPLVVTASQGSLLFFARITVGHVAAVAAASLFSFMTVFALMGGMMAVLPTGLYRRASSYMSSVLVMAMMVLLSTGYSLSSLLTRTGPVNQSWLRFLPSVWFLGLCQSVRGTTNGAYEALAPMAGLGLLLVTTAAFLAYAISYRRHFVRTAEISEATSGKSSGTLRTVAAILDGWVLRTPLERAGFRFIVQTLIRSTPHRLVLAASVGVGVMTCVQTVAFSTGATQDGLPSVAWLAVGLILNFCLVVGLRFAFDLPAEINANWTFQLMVGAASHRCIALGRTVILVAVLLLTGAVELPLYVWRWGWRNGVLHVLVVTAASVLLTELLLANFRKIPCTCTYPKFKEGSVLGVLFLVLGFVAFCFGTAAVERWAYESPWRFMVFVPLLAASWYGLNEYRAGLIDRDRELTFEERSPQAVEVLNLGADG